MEKRNGKITFHVNKAYMCHKLPLICSVCRNHNSVPSPSWQITGFVAWHDGFQYLVEQSLFTIPEHPSSPGLSGIRMVQSLVFCVAFCRPLFITYSLFVLTIVSSACHSCSYGICIPIYYIETVLILSLITEKETNIPFTP